MNYNSLYYDYFELREIDEAAEEYLIAA